MRTHLRKLSVVTLLLALAAPRAARGAGDGKDEGEDRWVAIQCGKLITGTGDEKEKVTLLIKNGKVELISEKVELPHPCQVIDASKLVVMPGLIGAHSRLSLLDYQRGGLRADLRVIDEFLPAVDSFEVALANGFTTLQLVAPGGQGVPGRSLVVRTADIGAGLVVDDDGSVKINLLNPAMDRRVLGEALQGAKREIEKVDKARADFEAKKKAAQEAEQKKKEEEAKKQQAAPANPPQGGAPPAPAPAPAPAEAPKPEEQFQAPPIAPPLQPFVDLIQKKPGSFALVKLGGASTYLHFLEATKDFDIAHVVYPEVTRAAGRPQAFSGVSGTDLHWAAKQFGEHKELVLLAPYLSYVQGAVDFINIPKEFIAAGARVALTPASDGADEFANFRFNVNELIKGGMKRADAIGALSKNAAEAVGLADRLGTIEPGKDANVLLLTGDPFDVQSQIDRVVIEGAIAWTRDRKARS